LHGIPFQAGHHAPLAGVDHLRRFDAEAGGEDAVMGGGGATPLDISQGGLSHFPSGQAFDLPGKDAAYSTQLHMPEGIDLVRGQDLLLLATSPQDLGPLAHAHHGERLTSRGPALDQFTYLLHRHRKLGQKDDVRSSRQAAHQSDPTGVTAHYFHHHHPVVRLGRGV
jgi:hypothetical protein